MVTVSSTDEVGGAEQVEASCRHQAHHGGASQQRLAEGRGSGQHHRPREGPPRQLQRAGEQNRHPHGSHGVTMLDGEDDEVSH